MSELKMRLGFSIEIEPGSDRYTEIASSHFALHPDRRVSRVDASITTTVDGAEQVTEPLAMFRFTVEGLP